MIGVIGVDDRSDRRECYRRSRRRCWVIGINVIGVVGVNDRSGRRECYRDNRYRCYKSGRYRRRIFYRCALLFR